MSQVEGDHAVPPPVQDEDGEGHPGDEVDRGEAFVNYGPGGGGKGRGDEGEEAEGEGGGMVERRGGQGGEGGVEDEACVWCVCLGGWCWC